MPLRLLSERTQKPSLKRKSEKDGNPSPGNPPPGNFLSEGTSDNKLSDNPYYNIAEETALLREIKDTRDELNILTNLAESQEVIWKQTFGADSLEDHSNFKYFHSCTPTEVKQELQEMAAEAEIVQISVGVSFFLLNLPPPLRNISLAMSFLMIDHFSIQKATSLVPGISFRSECVRIPT